MEDCRHGLPPLWCTTCRDGWYQAKIVSAKKAGERAQARGLNQSKEVRRAKQMDKCWCQNVKFREQQMCFECARTTQAVREEEIDQFHADMLAAGHNWKTMSLVTQAVDGGHGENARHTRITTRLHANADHPALAALVRD